MKWLNQGQTITLLWEVLVDNLVMAVMFLAHRGMPSSCWLWTLVVTHSCVISLLGHLRWHIQIMWYFVKTTESPFPSTEALEYFQSLVFASDSTCLSIHCWHSTSLGNFCISNNQNSLPCGKRFYHIIIFLILFLYSSFLVFYKRNCK